MTEEKNNTEKQCDIHVVIERLKKLQRWDTGVYNRYECVHEVCIEKNVSGEWIKSKDVEELIRLSKLNAL
mgnify:CR=1 FL=1